MKKIYIIFVVITCAVILRAQAGIDLISIAEDSQGGSTVIRLDVTKGSVTNFFGVTEFTYPGRVSSIVREDGSKVKMLANKDASIVGFNFRAGTKSNDMLVVIKLKDDHVVLISNLARSILRVAGNLPISLSEGFLHLTDISGDNLIISYNNPASDKVALFEVNVSNSGGLSLVAGSFKVVPK